MKRELPSGFGRAQFLELLLFINPSGAFQLILDAVLTSQFWRH